MTKSFIEVQFPIEELSVECYKERMAGSGQTLTGLGKWWGRKPLILVRAVILGSIMPASDDSDKDMEIFKKILTMDKNGLWLRRKKKNMDRAKFDALTYEEKLRLCVRPEHIDNLPEETWKEVNDYLSTTATNFQELFQQLGRKKFGEIPKVLDCFAGGGSIPFEAARLGCEAYASDLNPVACMLNWANLNILSKSDDEIKKLKKFQQKVYDSVQKQVDEWGIEKNEDGEVADVYLYLNESKCPHCNTMVPLAPSFIISKKTNTIAKLTYNKQNKNFDIIIEENASTDEVKKAGEGTVKAGRMNCPHCSRQTMIETLRGDNVVNGDKIWGLRRWNKDEFVPKETDVFQERLYCIRYVDKEGKKKYITPTKQDLEREAKVVKLLSERFSEWQEKGYIPSDKIEEGEKTNEPIRTRGCQYWHQLFNPRQLLVNGLFNKLGHEMAKTKEERVLGILGIN